MSATELTPEKRRYFRRIIASALVGNMLEFYDLFMFGFLAVYISNIFFPTDDPYTSLLITLATFGISYFVRPLGAILIGSYSDRHGRKAGMILTIWAMGVGTGIIAFAPSYASWGIFGAITVVLGKFIQGFSAGGEFGTSVAFVTEHAPKHMRGYFASYQVVGIGLATGLAGLVSLGLNSHFSPEQITSWAWRLPFILGLVVVPFGYWIRQGLDETPEFMASVKAESPVKSTLSGSKARITCAIGVYSLAASTNYLLGVFIPLYAQKELGMSPADSMWGAVGYALAQIFLPPVFGALSDRVGRIPMITLGIVLTGVFTIPAFEWMVSNPTVGVYVTCVTGLTACVMVFQGAMPSFLAELFPNSVRTTGLALIHNLNFTVVGGLSLLICTWLARETGSKFIPAYYVMATVALALCCVCIFIRKARQNSVAQGILGEA
ncbi:MFS transporter [Paralcaligenes ureilyticus]|uniref:MHS family proline/betaine transporter-like MFS transporter n=1 Tax=Paralcaligenes ureilyticus TaxID=627131 RepID=A0A4V2UZ94_9BURK|nr:MFS transporter [Paralcaligenes ureilyticus]TCT10418.1 MHS family proline/betaine transporter-like MFS transporter [Paralcaligenes ureilyticus]